MCGCVLAGAASLASSDPDGAAAAIELERFEATRAAVEATMERYRSREAEDYAGGYALIEAALSLEQHGDEVLPFLGTYVDGAEFDVFGLSALTVGRIGTPPARTLLHDALDRLADRHDRAAGNMKAWICTALGLAGDPSALDRMDELGVAEFNPVGEWSALSLAATYLGETGRDWLLERIAATPIDPDAPSEPVTEEVRIRVEAPNREDNILALRLRALAHTGTATDDAPIARFARHPSDRVRIATVDVLRSIATRSAADLLAEMMIGDTSRQVRSRAANGFYALRGAFEYEDLLALLERAEDAHSRGRLYSAIVERSGPKALPALVSHRGRPDPLDRAALIRAAGRTRSPDALPLVRSALRDKSQAVVESAVRALAEIGSPGARESLLALIRDERERIVQATVRSLVRIREPRAGPRIAALLLHVLRRPIEPELRSKAREFALSLAALGYTEANDDLERAIATQPTTSTREALTAALEQLRARERLGESADAWLDAIHVDPADHDHGDEAHDHAHHHAVESVVFDSVEALAWHRVGTLGDRGTAKKIAKRFDGASGHDRVEVVRALGRIGPPARGAAAPVLARVLDSEAFAGGEHRRLRAVAAWAAVRIEGANAAPLLRAAARRSLGIDTPTLVYLLAADDGAIETVRELRSTRLRAPFATRDREQSLLDDLVLEVTHGLRPPRFEADPEELLDVH